MKVVVQMLSTVAASIVAEADNAFASDNNQTDMVFKLGSSEGATEKMRLTHEGDLNLITDSKSINFGADSEVSLTHVHNLGLLLNSTRGIFFDDAKFRSIHTKWWLGCTSDGVSYRDRHNSNHHRYEW